MSRRFFFFFFFFAQTTKIPEKNKAVLYDPASLAELLDASEVRV